MSSALQIEANRANALLSTGPCTPEGKAASSQNARTHGLTSSDLVVLPSPQRAGPAFDTPEKQPDIGPGRAPFCGLKKVQDDFLDFQIGLTEQIKPNGTLELTAFDNLLHAAWNMRRIRRLEAHLAASGIDPLADSTLAAQCDRYARYFARAEKSYYRALRELRTLQADRAVLENANHPNEANFSPLVPLDKLAKRTHRASTATIDYSEAPSIAPVPAGPQRM